MKYKIIEIVLVLLATYFTSSYSLQEETIDIHLSRDHTQKQIYTFNEDIIKATIMKDSGDIKTKETICEIKKQKLKLKTTFNGLLPLNDRNEIINKSSSYFFISKYKKCYVAIKKTGDIAIFQIKDNVYQLISYTESYTTLQQTTSSLIQVFIQGDFLYLISANQTEYLLKTFLLSSITNVKSVYDEPMQILDSKVYGKHQQILLQGDYLYILSKFYILFVINIEPVYKHPKLFREIYFLNTTQPHSFDLDNDRVYMLDERKGIISFQLSFIFQESNLNQIQIQEETLVTNKQKQGKLLIKPFQNETYFLVVGKENQRNYIAEVQNDKTLSTSDDEPKIKKVFVNQEYIYFLSEDNIHLIQRGINESELSSLEKQYTFEVIGVQDFYVDRVKDFSDNSNSNKYIDVLYAITNKSILELKLQKISHSTFVCYCNQNLEENGEQNSIENVYHISLLSSKCEDETVRYCTKEMQINVYLGNVLQQSDTEAFIFGFSVSTAFIIVISIIYYYKNKNKTQQKQPNYDHFHNEKEQELTPDQESSKH